MKDSPPLDDFVNTSDALFHYTRASIALEKILFDGRFRLSLLKDTNDPSEYKVRLLNMIGWSLPPEAERRWGEAHIIDRIIRFESRIMSFCTNLEPEIILDSREIIKDTIANRVGWNKSRMWAQYGDNHRGICLVFSKKEIESEFGNISEKVISKNIKYKTEPGTPLSAYTLDGNKLIESKVEDYCYNHVIQHAETLFFIKHVDYRDESEHRIVVLDRHHKHEYINIDKFIKGVIAGDRTPKVYFPLIRALSDRYGVECRRVFWERGVPHLIYCNAAEINTYSQ